MTIRDLCQWDKHMHTNLNTKDKTVSLLGISPKKISQLCLYSSKMHRLEWSQNSCSCCRDEKYFHHNYAKVEYRKKDALLLSQELHSGKKLKILKHMFSRMGKCTKWKSNVQDRTYTVLSSSILSHLSS